MNQITYEDAARQGIDMSMTAVCRKLRRLAKLDRLKLDESEHRSGLNRHLFDYIEYCGRDVLDFVKQYLSNLQPYMIEWKKDQEPEDSFICVIDNVYRISVYIKADNRQFEEVIVSFHENNKRGIAKTNRLIQAAPRQYVPVFADSVLSCVENENRYVVRAFFQRGLTVLGLELAAAKCGDVFLVEKMPFICSFYPTAMIISETCTPATLILILTRSKYFPCYSRFLLLPMAEILFPVSRS